MREPRSYVVRIYHRGFRSVSGIVEDTRTNGVRPFRTTEELIALLRAPIPSLHPTPRRPKSRSTN